MNLFERFDVNIFASRLLVPGVCALSLAVWAAEEEDPFFNAPKLVVAEPDPVTLGLIDSRQHLDLNGEWNLIVDPMETGTPGGVFGGWATTRLPEDDYQLLEYNYPNSRKIRVPGDFNTQHEDLFFYRDSVWYQRDLSLETLDDQARYHLWLGGANYTTTVFLNGAPVVRHVGGYVPFSVDVTEHLQPGTNDLVVWVNNRLDDDSVPTKRTDWWPYGGLTRDVMLVKTPSSHIVNAKFGLSADGEAIEATVQTRGLAAGSTVHLAVPELELSLPTSIQADGSADWRFEADVERWSPDSPKRYRVTLRTDNDSVEDLIGFRTIRTDGQTIVLNDQPIKLAGISTHEEAIGRDGVAFSEADMRALFEEAKALGVNFVRLAHYPYSRHAAKVADELGLLLWEEVPIYWNIAWDNPETLAIARDQVKKLVQRDWNRASVIIWSVANETPYSESRMAFLQHLIDDVRTMDSTRMVTAALLGDTRRELKNTALYLAAYGLNSDVASDQEKAVFQYILDQAGAAAPAAREGFTVVVDDPLGELVDVVSYNQYFGWYYSRFLAPQLGVSERTVRQLILELMPNMVMSASHAKPMLISEFGAGAKRGLEGDGVWTEDYQARVYRAQTAMLANSPQVQGMTPWILKDFRAMLRTLPGIQDYRNRKGLIDENGERKAAFYVLRDFYRDDWGRP